jgi:hypothetical protein
MFYSACCSYSDKTLANILTPREKLCGKKFELRIDDVLFVGHPTLVTQETQSQVYSLQTISYHLYDPMTVSNN